MRTVTVAELIRRARKRADMEHSRFFEDPDMIDLLNAGYTELYDTLVQAYENYYVAETTVTLTAGTDTYNLPSNFYKIIGVDYLVSGTYITLFPFNEADRNQPFAGNNSIPSGSIRIRYVPAPATFTTADIAAATTIDGVSGWDELVVVWMACRMLEAEESDTTAQERQFKRLMTRIEQASQNRDTGMPARVTDVYAANSFFGIWDTLRYRLYGNQLRLINTEFLGFYTAP